MRDGVILRADVYRPAGDGPVSGAPAAHAVFEALRGRRQRLPRRSPRQGFVVDRAGHARPLHVGRRGPPARRGRGWLRHHGVGAHACRTPTARSGCSAEAIWRRRNCSRRRCSAEGLVALFPSSSYNSRYDMVFQGGAFYLNDGLGWNLGQMMDVRRRMFTPDVESRRRDRDGRKESRAGLPQRLAVARAAQDDGRARARKVRAGLSGDAQPSELRRVLGDLRHRSASTTGSRRRHITSPAGTTRCSPARCATSLGCGSTRGNETARRYQRLVVGPGRTRGRR